MHHPLLPPYGWCSENKTDGISYLQVNLGEVYVIDSVSTWGHRLISLWVTSYNLSYGIDGATFVQYFDNPLPGNLDNVNEKKNILKRSIIAQYLRFTPITWYWWRSMRIEATGTSLVSYLLHF